MTAFTKADSECSDELPEKKSGCSNTNPHLHYLLSKVNRYNTRSRPAVFNPSPSEREHWHAVLRRTQTVEYFWRKKLCRRHLGPMLSFSARCEMYCNDGSWLEHIPKLIQQKQQKLADHCACSSQKGFEIWADKELSNTSNFIETWCRLNK